MLLVGLPVEIRRQGGQGAKPLLAFAQRRLRPLVVTLDLNLRSHRPQSGELERHVVRQLAQERELVISELMRGEAADRERGEGVAWSLERQHGDRAVARGMGAV